MKLDHTIADVQEAEAEIAQELRKTAERHATESGVYHTGHTLADRCDEQLERLRPFADRYGAPDRDDAGSTIAIVERVRRLSSQLLGRHELSGMLLLSDLRGLYVLAQDAEIRWTILVQAAKSSPDVELVNAAQEGREHAEIRARWVRTMIKETCPQVLVAG